MCKLFIATGSFSKSAVVAMVASANKAFNSSQRDGFGFVAYGGKRKIAYGKYLEPNKYVGFDANLPKWVHSNHIEVGKIPEVTTALVVHGRTSTNKVVIENAHPFYNKGTFLAHNGVLSWIGDGPVPDAANGCDTEQFFNWFNDNGNEDSAWSATHEHWSGYGVFGVVDSNKGTLTVAKCGSGNLRWVGSDGNHFFSTDGNDLVRITRSAKFKCSKTSEMTGKTRVVFKLNATSSTIKSVDTWKGFGERVVDESWRRSMGNHHHSVGSLTDRRDRETVKGYITKTSETSSKSVSKHLSDDLFNSVSVPRYPDNVREFFPDHEAMRYNETHNL